MKITLFDDHDKFEQYHLIHKNITNVYNEQFDLLSARCYWYKSYLVRNVNCAIYVIIIVDER